MRFMLRAVAAIGFVASSPKVLADLGDRGAATTVAIACKKTRITCPGKTTCTVTITGTRSPGMGPTSGQLFIGWVAYDEDDDDDIYGKGQHHANPRVGKGGDPGTIKKRFSLKCNKDCEFLDKDGKATGTESMDLEVEAGGKTSNTLSVQCDEDLKASLACELQKIPCGGDTTCRVTIIGPDGLPEVEWEAYDPDGRDLMATGAIVPNGEEPFKVFCKGRNGCELEGIENSEQEAIRLFADATVTLPEEGTITRTSNGVKLRCVEDGIVEGDPHFRTWFGKWYEFMGGCDLVLLSAPNFDQGNILQVNIRTKVRDRYSYVESAVIKIGDEMLEVSSFGTHFLNGVEGSLSTSPINKKWTLAGYPLNHTQINKKKHEFEIHMTEDESIVVSVFKDIVSVDVSGAEKARFKGSRGMMGDFETGKMIGRDGITVFEEPNLFAAEWQVRHDEPMLFQAARAPQHPDLCEVPKQASMDSRGRQLRGDLVSRQEAETACDHLIDDNKKSACVSDVLMTGDTDFAGSWTG